LNPAKRRHNSSALLDPLESPHREPHAGGGTLQAVAQAEAVREDRSEQPGDRISHGIETSLIAPFIGLLLADCRLSASWDGLFQTRNGHHRRQEPVRSAMAAATALEKGSGDEAVAREVWSLLSRLLR
jgi:hypothetical protein